MTAPAATFDVARAARYDDEIAVAIPGYGVLHALTATVAATLLAGAPRAGAPVRVLLAGAGTGAELSALAAVGPAWHFVAADPSAPMLEHLRRRASALRLGARVTVFAGEVRELPAGDAAAAGADVAFDAATLLLVLHFLPDDGAKLALLRDVAARLRPGAPLLLADMAGDTDSAEYGLLLGAWEAHLRTTARAPADAAARAVAAVRAGVYPVHERRLGALLEAAGFGEPVRYWQGLTAAAWVARRAG
jgi:tRNA (cmo5U34)-methyltransferase